MNPFAFSIRYPLHALRSLMRSLTLQSPAKVNLYLRVLGRGRDGHHRIASLFHRISLADILRLTKRRSGFSLRSSLKSLPVNGRNILTRAHRLLAREVPSLGGVSVYLKKKIPLASGLGGGSSNAAAFLLGMKRLYGLRISKAKLVAVARRLGADVPFFLYDVNQATGTGLGDRIRPRPVRKRKWFVLVISRQGLSTRKVYKSLPARLPAVSLTKVSRAVTMLCNFLEGRNFEQVGGWLRNDLEPPAFSLRPSLRSILAAFHRKGIQTSGMSGSGPTLYAILRSRREAEQLAGKFRRLYPSKKFVVCHSV